MKKIIFYLSLIFFTSPLFSADEKPGRFFEDQPDVTDDHQIHFNYVLASDSEDREMDINGKMEEDIKGFNELFFKMTKNKQKWKIDMFLTRLKDPDLTRIVEMDPFLGSL